MTPSVSVVILALIRSCSKGARDRLSHQVQWRPQDRCQAWCNCLCSSNSPAPSFEEVQKKVAEIIKGRIVVGHALSNDFKASQACFPDSHGTRFCCSRIQRKRFATRPATSHFARRTRAACLRCGSLPSTILVRTSFFRLPQGLRSKRVSIRL